MAIRTLSLCHGYGGIERGLREAGLDLRVVCAVEIQAFAAANLVQAMRDGAVAEAPVWSDLATFDAEPWRGVVDLVTAGFPCQPFSVAGHQRGVRDERWLWPDIERIIEECQPSLVFLENVPAVRSAGLPHILEGLSRLGFDAEWGCIEAATIGATHSRDRWFALAYPSGEGPSKYLEWKQGGPVSEAAVRTSRRFPPGPEDAQGWVEYLNARGPRPQLRGGPDGCPNRNDRIRMLGAGAVPAQVALALLHLLHRSPQEPHEMTT